MEERQPVLSPADVAVGSVGDVPHEPVQGRRGTEMDVKVST